MVEKIITVEAKPNRKLIKQWYYTMVGKGAKVVKVSNIKPIKANAYVVDIVDVQDNYEVHNLKLIAGEKNVKRVEKQIKVKLNDPLSKSINIRGKNAKSKTKELSNGKTYSKNAIRKTRDVSDLKTVEKVAKDMLGGAIKTAKKYKRVTVKK